MFSLFVGEKTEAQVDAVVSDRAGTQPRTLDKSLASITLSHWLTSSEPGREHREILLLPSGRTKMR